MSAPMPLAIGMYVRLPGKSTGRIVDRQVRDGANWWLVKLDRASAGFLWARSDHLTPRVDA